MPIYALVKDCDLDESSYEKSKLLSSNSLGGSNEIGVKAENIDRKRRKRVTESRSSDRTRVNGDREKALRKSDRIVHGVRKNDVPVNEVVPTRADTIRDGNSIPETENRLRKLHFHVTYWMFYPFSEGKALCVLDLGFFGSWPIPSVGGLCLGRLKEYGNHVGDWEHMSLYFKVAIFIFVSRTHHCSRYSYLSSWPKIPLYTP